ncbi:MAG: hypothetical protein EHM41_05435 [Chloroflexi bacterium]|nr:MAG: hypothetical protein EHM41_05435 [Chloroflexota bacterium]
MLEQVTVTSKGPASIKPLLKAAIQSQLRTIEHGIKRTHERLGEFEKRYQMVSVEFEKGFESGKIEESLDFIEWSGELKTLHILVDQLHSLQSAKVK